MKMYLQSFFQLDQLSPIEKNLERVPKKHRDHFCPIKAQNPVTKNPKSHFHFQYPSLTFAAENKVPNP